ncbi:MAG: SDR family oxidoreductase [Pigmentiphaga sp.]
MSDAPQAVRRALVLGAASGIGAAVVQALSRAGLAVVGADLDGQGIRQAAQRFGVLGVQVDASDFDRMHDLVAEHGPFDVLVNCVGADQHAFFTHTSPAQWSDLLRINLGSALNATHAVLPGMQAAAYGRIVHVASEAGRLGSRGGAVYAAAKGGVIAFSRSIARENGHKNITVNVVAPGPIDTPMLRHAVEAGGEKLMQAMVGATLARRLGTPTEVAAAVAFLASEEAAYITGEVLGVSGGMGCGA